MWSQSLAVLAPLLAPVVVLQLGLLAVALYDLVRRDRVRFDNKLVWGAVILIFGLIGPLVYFTVGREEA